MNPYLYAFHLQELALYTWPKDAKSLKSVILKFYMIAPVYLTNWNLQTSTLLMGMKSPECRGIGSVPVLCTLLY